MRNKRLSLPGRVFQRRPVTRNTSSRRKFFARRGQTSKQSSKSNSLISPSYYDDNSYLHDYPKQNANKAFVDKLENDLEFRFAQEMFSKKKERSNLMMCLPVQFEQKEHLKNLTAVLQKDEVSWWEEESGPGDTYDSTCAKSTISSAGSFLGD